LAATWTPFAGGSLASPPGVNGPRQFPSSRSVAFSWGDGGAEKRSSQRTGGAGFEASVAPAHTPAPPILPILDHLASLVVHLSPPAGPRKPQGAGVPSGSGRTSRAGTPPRGPSRRPRPPHPHVAARCCAGWCTWPQAGTAAGPAGRSTSPGLLFGRAGVDDDLHGDALLPLLVARPAPHPVSSFEWEASRRPMRCGTAWAIRSGTGNRLCLRRSGQGVMSAWRRGSLARGG